MAVEIITAVEKTAEIVESMVKNDAIIEAVAEAETLVKDIWPQTESEIVYNKGVSPNEIGKEAWDSLTTRLQAEIEEYSDAPRYIITRNEALENQVHPITGVSFERKIVELPTGEKIEGVFPIFEYVFETHIQKDLYYKSDKDQFKECNKQLLEAINNDPTLRKIFSPDQIEQIKDGVEYGDAPDGFVWHHDAEAGTLQLVDFEIHSRTGHTGGRSVWGGGSEFR